MKKRILAAGLISLTSFGLLWAAADGVPALDPTFGDSNTPYEFTLTGSSKSMDPVLKGGSFTWKGTMSVTQDQGEARFTADMDLDQNLDGIMDRQLNCSGLVGNGSFGMRCTDSDGGTELRFTTNGKAVVLDSGRLSLRKAAARGYTDTYTFLASLTATQQVP